MVATILNNEGQTYNPPNTKLEVKFTKDNLYQIYWDSMRNYMFPNKEGQLSTKEFSELVEMAMPARTCHHLHQFYGCFQKIM